MVINKDSAKVPGQLYHFIANPFEKEDLWDTEPYIRDSLLSILHKIRKSNGSNERFLK